MYQNPDAFIGVIHSFTKHTDPEVTKLEIAKVQGWQVVVPIGQFQHGEKVCYICPDATISEDAKWFDDLGIRKYLGNKNRVKSIRLRGELSNGIVLKFSQVPIEDSELEKMKPDELCAKLGIGHYMPPVPQDLQARSSQLPPGISVSDETNFQSLYERDLHLGETALITRKMDGCSALIYSHPDLDDYIEICGRRLNYRLECQNRYTEALMPLKECCIALAKYFKEPIALRGEICGEKIQTFAVNKDCKQPPTFYMYGVNFPMNDDFNKRHGYWKSGRHFTDINKILVELGYQPVKTVPVLGEAVLTMELLQSYENAPADEGEGVVVNGETFSYKAKSADYDIRAHG